MNNSAQTMDIPFNSKLELLFAMAQATQEYWNDEAAQSYRQEMTEIKKEVERICYGGNNDG